jgi:hypothetical protein
VNDELERMRKEVVVTYFKVVFQYLPGGDDEGHANPVRFVENQTLQPPKYEPGLLRSIPVSIFVIISKWIILNCFEIISSIILL